MPLPHDLKIGDTRQTRNGNTVTLVAYHPDRWVDYRLVWNLESGLRLTTSERGVYCEGLEDVWDIPSLSVKRVSPQAGMMVRNLRLGDRVGVIVTLAPKLTVRYEDGERGQYWTTNAEVKWPWEDEWQLASHPRRSRVGGPVTSGDGHGSGYGDGHGHGYGYGNGHG